MKNSSRTVRTNLSWNGISDLEIADEIEKNDMQKGFSVEYNNNKDIEKYTAELLSQGEIVARFKDRMEWGARSLGNRSILADPSSFDKIRDINLAIKQRDFWMPFAPSIISEKQEEYIENPKKIRAPYMVMGFHTKKRAYKELASAIHSYDFTARPQLLEKKFNPAYYDLIKILKNIQEFQPYLIRHLIYMDIQLFAHQLMQSTL